MDDKPKSRSYRGVKGKSIKAISSIVKVGTKKRNASTDGRSGRAQKALKLEPYRTPSQAVYEGVGNVNAPFPDPRMSALETSVIPSVHPSDEVAEDVRAFPSSPLDEGAEDVRASSGLPSDEGAEDVSASPSSSLG